ncbi:pyridoxamine 5-phosphate oxidase [Hydrogenovibrio sp. SC-1]|uniref:HugZ family pyridoxamine 5'-phosphate oxidase n=1 Tax=Hydrogenovibrio sp. SC-1 TaxID=2065820 RepID=UPI000C7D4D0E|nr:pyridoxamine 5'-phosphate oxidase family protein [Hydrogenovibrio sp. SC-1]PLA74621.1 pyridoxamine 5-phosphate oxidase [Hydrogenovibrio sp. SC-1]
MKPALNQIANDFHAFIGTFQSAILATVNATGTPDASYAPILQQNGHFYIFISELAQHTDNLMKTPAASLLFIEAEETASDLFARKRATLKVSARAIERTDADWSKLIDAMEAQLGEMISVLRNLADFHLFELTPTQANFVKGFAQAYELDGEMLQNIQHRKAKGHRSTTSSK